ncbi:hypothetical protein AXE65_05705 [Ventosimonas gracilis]|uniref:Flagella basal body P-ring formation protein FlgA n=1 Tax=Ventosimonas gracilis TaxID=1680762 RepID=A0A139SNS9_9GAMM|nr:flagellar basal body P-ring formation chaperone FlgA [Ventosimonas gracilis]KXU36144.1 hypothetical protein AXE65_05705 [Ventosimonas gracilis]
MKLISPLIGLWLTLPFSCFAANEAVIGNARVFLEQQVKDYLQQMSLSGRWQIEFAPIDARLSAKSCKKPLMSSLEGRVPLGRLSVRVRCTEPAWTLLLPARVQLWQRVLVARHPLKRGHWLSAEDVTWVLRDIGSLPPGWLTEFDALQGQQLTRSVSAGQLLMHTQLKAALLIAAGEQVQILSGSGGIRVQMAGEALSGGSLGQQIRVRNLTSGRTLRARVIARGQVEVDG